METRRFASCIVAMALAGLGTGCDLRQQDQPARAGELRSPASHHPPAGSESGILDSHEAVEPSPRAAEASGAPPPAGVAEPAHYTSLQPPACKVERVDHEAGGGTSRCPGLRNYALRIQDSDARMSIDVLAPDGQSTPLKLASLAGGGAFSSLGPRAEWRLDTEGRPAALIVRFDVFEDPDRPDHPVSYLVVSRLAPGRTCAVARVPPGADQNQRAREIADGVARMRCLDAQ